MMSAREAFMEFLRRKGLSLTAQRALVVDIFLEEEGHFTSEELHGKVRKRDPGVGQATVYRTLRLLVESGLAGTLNIDGGSALYEHSYGHKHHDHLVCSKCNRKVEVVDQEIEDRQVAVAKKYGFTLTRHSMLLFGVCPKCREKGEESDS